MNLVMKTLNLQLKIQLHLTLDLGLQEEDKEPEEEGFRQQGVRVTIDRIMEVGLGSVLRAEDTVTGIGGTTAIKGVLAMVGDEVEEVIEGEDEVEVEEATIAIKDEDLIIKTKITEYFDELIEKFNL
jgi:hypothetical protein